MAAVSLGQVDDIASESRMVIIDASSVLGRHPGATPAPWFALWLDTQFPGELVVRPGSGPRPLLTFRTMGGPLSIHIQVGNI